MLKVDSNQIITAESNPKEGKDIYRITVEASFTNVAGFRLEAIASDKAPGPGRGSEDICS